MTEVAMVERERSHTLNTAVVQLLGRNYTSPTNSSIVM